MEGEEKVVDTEKDMRRKSGERTRRRGEQKNKYLKITENKNCGSRREKVNEEGELIGRIDIRAKQKD